MSTKPDDSRRFLFVLSSARVGGNAEQLAREASLALPADVEQRWIRLSETPLQPFVDIRHDAGVYPPPEGHEATLAHATLWCTDLVMVVPVYWYSLPASAKLYLDHWSGWMRVPGMEFKARMAGKRLWGVTVISGDDAAGAEPAVGTLRLTANYLRMEWKGVLLGHGSRPGDVATDAPALAEARRFFTSVA